MRLWHKDLIDVLPRKQLLSQWSECCTIAKRIRENGTPNHILVNKVTDYDIRHLIDYSMLVAEEMERRGYNVNVEKFYQHISLKDQSSKIKIEFNELFEFWHDTMYLRQCYYNLQEKYDCGAISKKEFKKLESKIITEIVI